MSAWTFSPTRSIHPPEPESAFGSFRHILAAVQRETESLPPDSHFALLKLRQNVDYVHQLFLRIEQSLNTTSNSEQKQAILALVNECRSPVRQLTFRILDLEQSQRIFPASAPAQTANRPIAAVRTGYDTPYPDEQPELERPPTPRPPSPPQSPRQLLDLEKATQIQLGEDILQATKRLRQLQDEMSHRLKSEHETTQKATDELNKNQTNMSLAQMSMASINRITEGRGWWGRMTLYAYIALLWVVALLVMLVMPKLRF